MSVNPSRVGVRQAGFTLIEVLVAMVVLSIGILGLMKLQGSALQQSTVAMQRTQATLLGYDIVDRMLANRDAANNGGYDSDWSESHDPVDCASVCSAAQLAEHDLAEWLQALARKLPEGVGRISVANNVATVTVRWHDAGNQTPVMVAVRTKI